MFGGFIILDNDKALLLNEDGVTAFTYPQDAQFILGTGNKKWRKLFIDHFLKYYSSTENHFPNFYSSKAYISKTARAGIGNVFCPFSTLNADATIGNFNCINIYASINHDCIVGDFNIFSPYAGQMGYGTMGNSNFIGTNAIIVPKIILGNDNTISSGECVFDNMKDREFFQSGIIVKKP